MESPDLSFERAALARGARFVVGIDEVGRGPLAGPVTAAAVLLDLDCVPDGIDDSKRLTPARRRDLATELAACATVSVAHASVEEIDTLNILAAAELAMCRAVAALPLVPCHLLIDGNRVPQGLPCGAEAVVGGDGRVLSIAAASIAAKVARDTIMVELAQQFPGYGWETNMGYSSKGHIAALQDLGVTPHHRRSFAPVHKILYQGKSVSL
ncbi:MAG: ribonuclease HII [Rhodosalinus sp.]|uniref:ribonuclease HII n=2 Tax=Rhodosalinus sp. TaxID=2047741 RepID=UPI00397D5EA3